MPLIQKPTPVHTRRWPNVGLMFAHRLRRWPNINLTLGQRFVFAGTLYSVTVLHTATRKNTVQILNHPSADAVTQNVHKSDTTASSALCQ